MTVSQMIGKQIRSGAVRKPIRLSTGYASTHMKYRNSTGKSELYNGKTLCM
jgi:hypothetical protein